jgi:diacylglycerol O-acyltransferase / wax synthase
MNALAEWSAAPEMNDLEAVMWRAERHPWLSSSALALEVLDTAPDWPRVRAAHDWASRLVPRFRQRVVDPALPLGPPVWTADEAFDLDYHLRRIVLPEGSGEAELLQFAQTEAMRPLDRGRPLWESTLVEGLPGGRAAYLLKAHHALCDGLGWIQLVNGVHSRTREPSRKRSPAPPEPDGRSALVVAADQATGYARRAAPALLRTAPALARALTRPNALAGDGLRFAGSLRRVAAGGARPSPLFAGRTGKAWRFQTLEVELDRLKAAGRAAGGSVNDAWLAALLGGLRRYHERSGVPVGALPTAMTVSTRAGGDAAGGNRFTAITVGAPADVVDPGERIAMVRGAVLTARAEPALDLAGVAAPVLSRIPSRLALLARGAVGARADLAASNFPGATEDVYLAGARVERIYAFGPLPGVAVMATLVSHGGVCCVALNCDGSVIEDPAVLRTCVQDGFDEVLALAGGEA